MQEQQMNVEILKRIMSEKEVLWNQKHHKTKRYITMTNARTTNERRDFKENYV